MNIQTTKRNNTLVNTKLQTKKTPAGQKEVKDSTVPQESFTSETSADKPTRLQAVSYTHLTLPTILRV